MATKQVSVRLVAEGGKQVRALFDGVGKDAKAATRGLSYEIDQANLRLAKLGKWARLAFAGAGAAAVAAGALMIRSSMNVIGAQVDMAASLDTTVASIQTLQWAGELAGVAMGEIESATKQLTLRLSQAAQGTGPAAKALDRLHLSAATLQKLPLDERIATIQDALAKFVPESDRAAVASELFGSKASLAFSRIDSATLRGAAKDLRDLGVIVSDADAQRVEATGDAIQRMGLIWKGVANQLTVAAAPALQATADAMVRLFSVTGPFGQAIRFVFENLDRLTTYALTFAGFMAGRWVVGLVFAAASVRGLAVALVVLRGALIRTGIGALIVAAGELVFWFGKLVKGAGGFGDAMGLLKDVAVEVWDRIGLGAASLVASLEAGWQGMKSTFFYALHDMLAGFNSMIGSVAESLNSVFGTSINANPLGGVLTDLNKAGNDALESSYAASGSANDLWSQAGAPLKSMEALRGAVRKADAEEPIAAAADAATELEEALDGAGAAGKAAGKAVKEGAEEAKTGWAATTQALADYVKSARDIGADLGSTLVDVFKGAEDALGEFVRTGKLQFGDLIGSMIADIAKLAARRFITGPLAGALSGALGGLSGGFGGFIRSALQPAVSFDGGGWTGGGARTGGLDGRGGFMAMLHPQETVVDHTRRGTGRTQSTPVTVNIYARDADSFRQSRTQVAADIARAVRAGQRGM